jgi:tetratricopeptide (TPR) repeat protein
VAPIRNRGNARMELGDYQGAVRDFTEAIRQEGPYMVLYYYGRGLALSKSGDLDAATDDLRKAIALEHEKDDGRAELAGILLRLGDTVSAVAEFDRAIAHDNSRLGLYLHRGEAYSAQDPTRAEEDFTRALALDSLCAEALAGSARSRLAQGRCSEANARQAIAIEPELGSLKEIFTIKTGA